MSKLEFSTQLKKQELTLSTSEGDVDLEITERTVGDSIYQNELMKPMFDEDDKLKANIPVAALWLCKIKAVLKHPDGTRFYAGEDVFDLVDTLPGELIEELNKVVDSVNPVQNVSESSEPETIDTKKNKD